METYKYQIPDAYKATVNNGRAKNNKLYKKPQEKIREQDAAIVIEHPFYKKPMCDYRRLMNIDMLRPLTLAEKKEFELLLLSGKLIAELPGGARSIRKNEEVTQYSLENL